MYITKLPEPMPEGVKFSASIVERVALLRAFCKSHGINLGLAESKKLVEINEPMIATIHHFVSFMEEVVKSRNEDAKNLG